MRKSDKTNIDIKDSSLKRSVYRGAIKWSKRSYLGQS